MFYVIMIEYVGYVVYDDKFVKVWFDSLIEAEWRIFPSMN